MKRLISLVISILLTAVNGHAQVFKVDTVIYNGDISKYINFVIMGDGYTSSQQGKFRRDVDSSFAYFFSQTPFTNYKQYFNLFAIEVISVDSGISHPNTAPDCASYGVPLASPNTYFNCSFDANNIHRLVTYGYSVVLNVLAKNFPAYDQALIMSNTPYYGGSGGQFAAFTARPQSRDVAAHELGHSFAGVADEYYAGDGYAGERVNMTAQSNPSLVRWKAWLGGAVGVYQHCCGGNSASWYKPTQGHCKMESLNLPFCAVCGEAIVESIHDRVNPVVSYLPAAGAVASSQQMLPFKLTQLMKPVPNTLRIEWKLNGTVIATNKDSVIIDQNKLPNGLSNLVVNVTDTTSFLRVTGHATKHFSTVSWSITKTKTGVLTQASNSEFSYSMYPNPATESLNIALNLQRRISIALQMFSTDGRLVYQEPTKNYEAGKQVLTMNVDQLPAGPYFFVMKIGDDSYTERWVKE
jgi:hypothetical protein